MATTRKTSDPDIRTISANEAKQRWGATMASVSAGEDEVVVESHGQPKVAVISYQEFEHLRKLREEERRQQAIKELEAIAQTISKRNNDLTNEDVEEIAQRLSRDLREERARDWAVRASDENP